jgi:hypothetical protein
VRIVDWGQYLSIWLVNNLKPEIQYLKIQPNWIFTTHALKRKIYVNVSNCLFVSTCLNTLFIEAWTSKPRSALQCCAHRYLNNIDCSSFMCPLLAPHLSRVFLIFFSFLLQPLTVLIRQTRQAVHAINQSIFLRCLWLCMTNHYNFK